MKKPLVLVFCLISILSFSKIHAQIKDKSFVQLGAKISPNIAWLNSNSSDITSDGTSLKFSWGFIADFRFAEKYFFSTGFNINSIGGRIIYPDADTALIPGTKHRNIKTKYVEIPVSVKMKTRQFGYLTIFGQVGLGLGMRISAYSDDDFIPNSSSVAISKTDIKIQDQINFFRLSMILAAGVEYNLGGSTSLIGAISFNNGFNNIFNTVKTTPQIDADASSNSFELSIGILF
ncbi:MAG: porin family protein [Bacteroidetes bacterium]|nr:porin family protein [Bacteroidota bacterium]